ncbi:energy-coupling factor ABC transporter ATP-binding protein [Anaerofustis stercorihominis]|uniref:energy-coupling factor ABC transporter ATP-binding protein n=1 Tax=Anaerofustis stercorihominis TaxID=214853 RepID=UPI00214C3B0E|nr:ABC transporter ATP-binding protein [Anaerofustis stercorihominis]MCR2032200.1 energy-coupling factor ABC transporter ATP-binding protein [Anaerofustis stercorihominis]
MISIKDLNIKYPDGTNALNNLNLDISDNENIGLLGANGAGKSTLFLSMLGVIPIADGSITIDDSEVNKNNIDKIRREVGLIFQNPDDQLFSSTVYDDVAFALNNLNMNKYDVKNIVYDILNKLGIYHLKDKAVYKLSGGEKRSACIASILVQNPNIILFDEPTSYLDRKSKRKLIEIINSINSTKLIASHDFDLIKETCTRIVILKNGSVYYNGNMDVLNNEEFLMEAGL